MAARSRVARGITPQRIPGVHSAEEVLLSARTPSSRSDAVGTPHLPRPLQSSQQNNLVRTALSRENQNRWVNKMYRVMYVTLLFLTFSTPTAISSEEASILYEQQEKLQASTSRIEKILCGFQQVTNPSSDIKKNGVPRELSVSCYI